MPTQFDQPFRKLLERPSTSWERLPAWVRGYGSEMLRYAERPDGRVCDTTIGADVAFRIKAHADEVERVEEAVRRLLVQGYLVERDGCLWIDNFNDYIARPNYWSRVHYAAVYERDSFTCRYCGACADLTIDHVVPRCQGGTDEPSNLVTACRRCNSRKGGRTPYQAGMIVRALA